MTPKARWSPRRMAAAATLLLTLGAATAGCGGGGHKAVASPTTSDPTDTAPTITVPPDATSTTPPTTANPGADNGQNAAILAAYQGSLTDFNQVASTAPVQANSPQLGNHMAGDELSEITTRLTRLASAGQIITGAETSLSSKVTQFNGGQAVVDACQRDTVAIVNATTHQVVTPASNSTENINALVQYQGGAWKVTRGSQVSSGC